MSAKCCIEQGTGQHKERCSDAEYLTCQQENVPSAPHCPPHATEAFRAERNATPDRLTPDTQKGYRDMHISSAVRPWIVTAARGGIGRHVGVWTGECVGTVPRLLGFRAALVMCCGDWVDHLLRSSIATLNGQYELALLLAAQGRRGLSVSCRRASVLRRIGPIEPGACDFPHLRFAADQVIEG